MKLVNALCAITLFATCAAAQDRVFEDQVRPILGSNCVPCHSAKTRSGGFSVDSLSDIAAGGNRRGPAITPGKPDDSVLIQALKGAITPQMPLGKPALPVQQVETISNWIASIKPEAVRAAPTRKWWSFEKLRMPALPDVRNAAWVRNEIDRFVVAKLEAKQLIPSPEATPRALLRRAFFDLIGLPPSLEEAKAFLADQSPNAYEMLVDRLLADPRFGERWGRHWLDLARYADTQGFEADRENYHMWRYRDYVIDAFNSDKPYDRFIQEQLAGDEMPSAGPQGKVATGFLRLGPRFQGTNAQEVRQMTLDEITGTVGSVFLGMTVKCAQCHDHKYDPIPQKDFYRLEAFFVPMELTEAKVEYSDASLKTRMEAAHGDCADRLRAARERFDAYQKQLLAKLEASGEKPKSTQPFAADDQGGVEGDSYVRRISPEVALLEGHLTRAIANGVVPNTDDRLFTLEEERKYLDLLSYVDGTRGGRDMGVLQRELRRYEPFAHIVKNAPNDSNHAAIPVAFVRVRGEFSNRGDWVLPGYPTALGAPPDPAELGLDIFGNVRAWRTPLANWIASPDNPTTARVMVNRIWQHLFGTAIVATPSDFGRNGARPSNQELLDWMAVRFVENKWSVKAMIRTIMLSSAYRQTSMRASVAEEKADPENQLLWRQNRKRLEGDILRDSVLAVSGRLNPARGGPGVFPRLPDALKDRMTIKNFPSWTPSDGPESRERSVYVFQRRQLEVPFLSVMDAGVFQTSCERRAVSTTALQALTLLNDDFAAQAAKEFADRITGGAGRDLGGQIDLAFRIALSRMPESDERNRARILVQSDPNGLSAFCRILINTNEFQYVD